MKEQRGSMSERWAIVQLYTYASWLRAKQAKSDGRMKWLNTKNERSHNRSEKSAHALFFFFLSFASPSLGTD